MVLKLFVDDRPHIEKKQLLDHLVDDRLRGCSVGEGPNYKIDVQMVTYPIG